MAKYIITLFTITLLLLAGAWFYSPKDNPILGQWISTDDFYGKPELLVFTEFGMLKDGSHVPADFEVGRQKVTVTTNIARIEYLIVSKNIIKQRVPRQTWRFFLRAEAFESMNAELNKNAVRRYSQE